MISKSLSALVRRAGNLGSLAVASVLGSFIALVTPFLAVVAGLIVAELIRARHSGDPENAHGFAVALPDFNGWLSPDWSPLLRVTTLLGIAITIILVTSFLLFIFYRLIQSSAVAFEVAIFDQLRVQARKLARLKTLSAQQQALIDCLDYHLPRVRACLSKWWRTFPRHVVQLTACLVVCLLIEPMLALLTMISTGLVVLIYRFLDRTKRTALPVVRERAAQQRGTLVELSQHGPLLESVHDEREIEHRFASQLAHYQKDAVHSLTSSAWKTPVILVVGGVLMFLFHS